MDDIRHTDTPPRKSLAQRAIVNPLQHLHDEMDRLIHDYAPRVRITMPWRGSVAGKHPIPVDMILHADGLEVLADMPGSALEEVDVKFANHLLTIKGMRPVQERSPRDELLYEECPYGAFHRELAIPIRVNEKKVEANLKNGVLRIWLPKSAEAKKHECSIPIRSE